jgi:predicted nucleotidyltransferase
MSEPRFRIRSTKFIDETTLRSFLCELENRVNIEALIVFGSRARGDALLNSDYDIAVISDDFERMSPLDRAFLLLDAWDADVALEPVAYTRPEFERAKGLLVWDILEEGLVLKDKGTFKRRKSVHDRLVKSGKLRKIEGGWKFAS